MPVHPTSMLAPPSLSLGTLKCSFNIFNFTLSFEKLSNIARGQCYKLFCWRCKNFFGTFVRQRKSFITLSTGANAVNTLHREPDWGLTFGYSTYQYPDSLIFGKIWTLLVTTERKLVTASQSGWYFINDNLLNVISSMIFQRRLLDDARSNDFLFIL